MTCAKCKREFILDPKKWIVGTNGITDAKFLGVLKRATANHTRYVTENELYSIARQRLKPTPGGFIGTFVGLLLGMAILSFMGWVVLSLIGVEVENLSGPWFAIPLAIFLFVSILVLRNVGKGLTREKWDKVVQTWQTREEFPNLLTTPALHQPPPEWSEPDVYDYGAERLLICERDLIVDWLVQNKFHLMERTLIVAESGYPQYLVPRAQSLLQSNSELPVFLLHDATPEGQSMESRIRNSPHFPVDGHPVTDLGVNADDVEKLRLPVRMRDQERGLRVDDLPYSFLTGIAAIGLADQLTLAAAMQSQLASGDPTFSFEVETDFG